MNVAFINENTLGHTSYLPRYVEAYRENPGLGVTPFQIDAMPLPPHLKGAERGIRGLHRLGLDGLVTRWRRATSRHASDQLRALRSTTRIDAVVVNTQSVGLALPEDAPDLPCLVALDATFAQLSRSPWFAPTRLAGWLQPITLRGLRTAERRLFAHASGFLPWAEHVAGSLVDEYGAAPSSILVLPPSLKDPGVPRTLNRTGPPTLLFVGGDFRRKGGPELLEAWRSGLRKEWRLKLVTRDTVASEPGLEVHQGVEAGSARWEALWREADVLVFPSRLETFGIVLLEAMAFGVPIIATRTGAAPELVEHLGVGLLISGVTPQAIADAVGRLTPESRMRMSAAGRAAFADRFELGRNAGRLAERLHALRRPR